MEVVEGAGDRQNKLHVRRTPYFEAEMSGASQEQEAYSRKGRIEEQQEGLV